MRVIAGTGGGSWSRRAAGRCGRPPTAPERRSSRCSAIASAALACSTSTAAPAPSRSRRSRAAPPSATLVDRDTRAALGNVENLGLGERVELVRADVSRWLANREGGEEKPVFDLVFIDAPYRLADRVGQELDTHLPRLLSEGGRAIIESGARPAAPHRLAAAPAPAPLRRRRRLDLRERRVMAERATAPSSARAATTRSPTATSTSSPAAPRSSSASSSASSTTRCARTRRSSPPRSARA